MATWDEFIVNAYNDVGNSYQQVLLQGTGIYQRQDVRPEFPQSINPEYAEAQRGYAAQEYERETMQGITEASYEPTNYDWEEYGRYLDEMKASQPEPAEPEPPQQEQGIEPER